MPEYSHLFLPRPEETARERLGPTLPPKLHKPSKEAQWRNKEPKLRALREALENQNLELTTAAPGTVAEDVIVFEVAGNIQDFANAVSRIEGFEWLLDSDAELESDDAFFLEDRPDQKISGTIYAVASNAQALKQIESLWSQHSRGEGLPRNFGRFKQLFDWLKEVRRWNWKDRIQEIKPYWQEELDLHEGPIRFQIEFWFRKDAAKRRQAEQRTQETVDRVNGRIVGTCFEHVPTAFHGAVVEVSNEAVKEFLEASETAELLQRHEVAYFRPAGQSAVSLNQEIPPESSGGREAEQPGGEPDLALLDGYPVENHPLLAGHLRVEDPDGWGAEYPVGERQHGTAMASLIVHGDLSRKEAPLKRPIYVRPILKPDPQSGDGRRPRKERIPYELFPQDILQQAVRRMMDGYGKEKPDVPVVKAINLSIGDEGRQFDGFPSPWARMVDWLSWKYGIVFVVSAGNHSDLAVSTSFKTFDDADAHGKERTVFDAIWKNRRHRRILSPAEAINALTLAAQHVDDAPQRPLGANVTIPVRCEECANPVSGIGPGVNRSVKPDALLPGGRQPFRYMPKGNGVQLEAVEGFYPPGQKVGLPPAGELSKNVGYSRGSSNAAALGTRLLGKVFDALRGLQSDQLPHALVPVVAKALVLHGASNMAAFDRLGSLINDGNGSKSRNEVMRGYVAPLTGYGSINEEIALGCDRHRVTLLGWGRLAKERGHYYRVPLPPSLSGYVGRKRLTITLAWLSPVNPSDKRYRTAALWFAPPQEKLSVRRSEADWRQARNGTAQHEVLEGNQAALFEEGDALGLQVNCRQFAGKLGDSLIPYGIAVSIEVAKDSNLHVYEEIRQTLEVSVREIS